MPCSTSHIQALTQPVICIVGPTASGKTDLGQELACVLDGEIVSADSMQIYRGMDIGTGKIPRAEQKVTHFGLDLVDPGQPYSASLFQDYARQCFADIASRGKQPFLVGGTGFYVSAALDAYDFPKGEQENNPIREKYQAFAQEKGSDALWELLSERDPESARVIHPHNVKRVIRAFEMLEEGVSYAQQKENLGHIEQAIPAHYFGIHVEPAVLNARIDKRIDTMVQQGLVDEVKTLLNQGFRDGLTAPQAIGYKEIVAALDGACSLDEAIESIKIATHRYGKRQRSWFRRNKRIVWIDGNDGNIERMTHEALVHLRA